MRIWRKHKIHKMNILISSNSNGGDSTNVLQHRQISSTTRPNTIMRTPDHYEMIDQIGKGEITYYYLFKSQNIIVNHKLTASQIMKWLTKLAKVRKYFWLRAQEFWVMGFWFSFKWFNCFLCNNIWLIIFQLAKSTYKIISYKTILFLLSIATDWFNFLVDVIMYGIN